MEPGAGDVVLRRLGARVLDVGFNADQVCLQLEDGRTLCAPLRWFPRLLHATAAQRAQWQLIPGADAVHWPEIDEDISVLALLGLPD